MRYYFIVLFLVFSCTNLLSQEISIEKSDRIEKIDGKEFYIHTVEKGQTLYSIARAYNTSLGELRELNPGANKELSIGQELKITYKTYRPDGFSPLNDGEFDFFYHISKAGESFQDVAYIYVVDPDLVKRANPDLKEPLKNGEYVKVPVSLSRKANEEEKTGRSELVKPVAAITAIEESGKETAEKPDKNIHPSDQEYTNHVVQKGQTLYQISKLYEVSLQQIRGINPGLTPDIAIGQVIRIPGKQESVLTESEPESKPVLEIQTGGFVDHEVKKGETLYRIAQTYKVSIDSLKLFNKGLDRNLRIGQIIRIPVSEENKKYIIHKVDERKDKLNKIARKYGVQVSDLMEINPEIRQKVFRGQIIRIPVEYETAPVTIKDTSTQLEIIRIDELKDDDSLACFAQQEDNLARTYKVALMLPFYLEEADSLQWDKMLEQGEITMPAPFRFIQFYEGIRLALDSLQKKGLNTELFVYDVGTDEDKAFEVLKKQEMRDMDLIIGPLFRKNFAIVSNFAKLYQINIVNPFTNSADLVQNNPYAFKVLPAIHKQVEQVTEFVLHKFPDAKIILVRDNEYRYQQEVNDFFAAFNENIPGAYSIPNYALHNILVERSQDVFEQLDNVKAEDEEFELLASLKVENMLYPRDVFDTVISDSTIIPNRITEVIYSIDSAQGIINNASVVRKNVIIAITEDKSQMLDILVNLNVMRDTFDIHLFGLPSWDDFAEFEPGLYANLDLHVLAPGFINYEDELTQWFIRKFRENYFTEPDYFAYQGFDIAWYFLSAMMNFGKEFRLCLPYFAPPMLQSQYIFSQDENRGKENAYWNIYNYRDFKLLKQPNYYFLNSKKKNAEDARTTFQVFQ
ncbi:MAG: LysM peptidoglycan-binding domain-containing protein [Bacteroidota bacterium]|nr:LysM peptidoglycan-binding domain-containing protein [Bacteroidota bacterium]